MRIVAIHHSLRVVYRRPNMKRDEVAEVLKDAMFDLPADATLVSVEPLDKILSK